MAEDPKRSHTLADHLLGQDVAHAHDGEADHDHDHFEVDPDQPLEENPIWIADHVTLLTVGIDIGSSGAQVIFSRINLRRYGEDLTSRYYVVSRETLFQSPVALTPYSSDERIDDAALGAIIDDAYKTAGVQAQDIDTGVVILTGEALRRENAEAIAALLAEQRGDFVTAAAGHHMESMLAAYGSGASKLSYEQDKRVLNVDIGGGTTKLGIVKQGTVIAMAELLVAALTQRPLPSAVEHLYLTDPIRDLGRIDGLMFSGGVGEYVYGREERDFGDMGRRLGRAIRARIDSGALPWPLLPPGECIRATALGASEYSVQLSGNTIYISNPGALLPRKNLQVLQPSYVCEEHIDPKKLADAIGEHFKAFDLIEGESETALALRWEGIPSYERIAAFALGIRNGLANTLAKGMPLYIMVDGDIAQTLGAILRDEMGVDSEILVIDGVVLWDFDYIDLGRIRMPSQTVPVTVKSLVFSEDPRGPHGRAHHRHHGHDRARRSGSV